MTEGAKRLERVTVRLVDAGVQDVKFFFAPEAFQAPLDKVFGDAAALLESYLDGRCTVVKTFAP